MTYKLLQQAYASYEEALAIAKDTELSPDGLFAVGQSGRA
jgi:hypothetical protein